MLSIGKAFSLFSIQAPTVGVDSNGAPFSSWLDYATIFAEIEGGETASTESTGTGNRRELRQTMTLIARCHPSQLFTPNMRAVDAETNDVYAIAATRYDNRRTTVYIDIEAGVSLGGIP